MKSIYSFIVKPLNKRYDNTKKIDDKTLIVNTSIENHRFVSKIWDLGSPMCRFFHTCMKFVHVGKNMKFGPA